MSGYVMAVASYDDSEPYHPVKLFAWPGPSTGPVDLPDNIGMQNAVAVAISPDGAYLVTTHNDYNDHDLQIFETAGWTRVAMPLENNIAGAIFAPNGDWLAIYADYSTAVGFYNTTDWTVLATSPVEVGGEIAGFALSPDGARLAVSVQTYPTGKIVVIDTATWTTTDAATFSVRPQKIAWSPNGNWLAVGLDGNENSRFTVLETTGWTVSASLGQAWEVGEYLAWSPDSTQLAGSGSYGIEIFDSATWTKLTGPELTSTKGLVYAPDGSVLHALGGDGNLRAYNTSDWTMAGEIYFGTLNDLAISSTLIPKRVAGTVLDATGAPAARPLYLLNRATQDVLSSTTSDAASGAFELKTFYGSECVVVAQDTTGQFNDLIYRVTPA